MKILFVVLSMLLIWNYSYGQPHSLVSVTIQTVDFNMENVYDVSCEAFDHIFNDGEKKTISFYNKKERFDFQALLKEFKPVKTRQSFDVRRSITYKYAKSNEKYCFDIFGYFYKGGRYYYNKQLLIYITDKIFIDHHPKYLDTLRQYE